MQAALNGNECCVLTMRKAEIAALTSELKRCKNKFRQQCIAQDLMRLKAEYDKIDSEF